jgi:hypothetical protein
MEFVVITGGTIHDINEVTEPLRAHGYHHFSPDQYFMDDFGDVHINPDKQAEAEVWCLHHLEQEIYRLNDVVCSNMPVNPELIHSAEMAGYHTRVIRLETLEHKKPTQEIEELVSVHEASHPSFIKQLSRRILG